MSKLGEMTFRLRWRKTLTFFQDRHVKLEYAMGAYPERRVGILIGDLEVVAKILLTAEFASFDGRLVIDRVFDKGPLAKGSRQGSRH